MEYPSLESNLHGLTTARLHSLNRSFADTSMMKFALLAALLALTSADLARRQLRGTDLAQEAESERRLHDLWYYAPHAGGQEAGEPSAEQRRLHEVWHYRPTADDDIVESPSVFESDEAIETLGRSVPFGF